ncbi:MAG: PAS domain S-box protein [Aulosira sp. ZfuVER01]|nr:PAS domain S-box protein [Aulosira sp. ZfuVER01]MDZ8000044.1 PAS domain S-box protein [Aulosira sp. DedVER01a]MDZ8056573.1 PAS domain S-box protein [Aulosira sp. ZfuCHP01]
MKADISENIFIGDSEMAVLMRSLDWSQTPLGPISGWAQSLKTSISILMSSRYPMFVWWGREYANLYNDAYRPMMGAKHPQFLGQSAKECWAGIWDVVGPLADNVLLTGQPTWSENLLLIMNRNGYPEEAYFTFSYNPVRDESGGVGGILCGVIETTKQVIGERRLRTLRELSASTGAAKTVQEACHLAMATLSANTHDLPFALLYLVEPDGSQARLVSSTTNIELGAIASPQLVDLNGATDLWNLSRVNHTREVELIEDLTVRFGALPGGAWLEPSHTALVMPLTKSGQVQRLAGLLVLGISPRHAWDDEYRGFFDLVASLVTTAIANAEAYQAERKRAEALAELDRAKTLFFSNVSHEFRTPFKQTIETFLSSISDGFYTLDRDWRFTYVNDRLCEMAGKQREELLGYNNWELFPDAVGTKVYVQFHRALAEQTPLQFEYLYAPWNRWFEYRVYPSLHGLTIFAVEVTDRKQAEMVLMEQKQLLELIALGQPLDECLSALCASLSRLNPRIRACILLTDAQGLTFPRSITPDFLPSFGQGLKDAPINELCIGTCGEAVYSGQPVTCADITNDDLWSREWRELCIAHGILACHSVPVLGVDNQPFGSLMLCFDEARMPTEWEYQLANFGTQVASIALERDRSNTEIQTLNHTLSHRVDELQALFDVLPVGVAIAKDPECRMVRSNPYLSRILRVAVDANASQSALADERPAYRIFKQGQEVPVEELPMQYAAIHNTEVRDEVLDIVHPDGSIIKLLSYAAPLHDAQGKVRGVIAGFADISDRIRTEAALRKSEEQFRLFVTASSDLVYKMSADWSEMHHLEGKDFLASTENSSRTWLETYIPQEDRPQVLATIQEAIRTKSIFELEHRVIKLDGTSGWTFSRAIPLLNEQGEIIEWFGTASDVSDRKQAEAEREQLLQTLAEERARFEAVLRQMPEGVIVADAASGKMILANEQTNQILRYAFELNIELEEYDQIVPFHAYHPDGRIYTPDDYPLARSLSTGEIVNHEEMEIRYQDGSQILIEASSLPIFDEQGQITSAVVLMQDITERKQIEQALRSSETLYRTLSEVVPDFIWSCDENGQADFVNPRWIEYTGLTLEELNAGGLAQVNHPEDFPRLMEQWEIAKQKGELFEAEFRYRRKDGAYRWFMGRAVPIKDDNGKITSWIGTSTDIHDRKQAEIALRESEEQFRRLANAMPQIVWTTNANGEVDYVSQQWFDYAGLTLEQTQDQTQYLQVIHPDDVSQLYAQWSAAIESASLYQTEVRIKRAADGKYRWFLTRAVPVKTEAGEIIAWYGTSTDIHDRKQAEVEREQLLAREQSANETLRRFIEHTPVAVVMLDREMRYLFASQRWMREYASGYTDLKGLSHYEVMSDTPERWRQIHQRCLAGATERCEEDYYLRYDGSAQWLYWEILPWYASAGEIGGIIIFAENITERKQAAQERQNLLEREQAAREQAETANRIKDEFLAVLSHELRSPMNPILGWAKLLQTGKLDEARTKQAIATIERNAKLQSELIEDLLDVSRILRGKLSLTVSPINLALTIQAAIETVRLAAEAKSIQIETRLDPGLRMVLGDSTRLQQVVWNLLSNAVKFTPPQGRVEVQLEQVGNQAQITVSDTGIGITPKFLPHVFEYFRQEDGATTRKFGGLGLGLAIVRHLVELHGGTVKAESRGEDLGATFTVRLPLILTQPKVNMDLQLSEPSLDLQGIQVLVVDDDTDTRDLVTFVLQQVGARVIAVSSASEAITALTQSCCDVLLSDIGMPEMDGYMLMRQIKALPSLQGGQIKAIALTAYAGDFNQQQALQAGFQRHIAKPIEPEQLIKAIVQVLAQSYTNP